MTATGDTSERADGFVRRQALWACLVRLFREHRPDRAQLAQVAMLAEVAIDQVFSAHRLPQAQRDERHGQVRDYAACAALYGYVLGYWQARVHLTGPPTPAGDDHEGCAGPPAPR